ncbi:MAG TPA: helix-turn-helix domain-containing protein [bacterium]|nr:helix-turn-helix domain-containing protein [bacterium]
MRLGAASRFLGVDPSTLRAWTDAGRVPVFRTPGGHRRYDERDLRAFLDRNRQKRESVTDIVGPRGARLVDMHLRDRVRAQDWYQAFDPKAISAMRSTCQRIMDGLAGYLAGGSRLSPSLREGERAGHALGAHVARLSMTPSMATQAFLFFRKMVTDAAARRLPLSPDLKVQSLQRLDVYLNQVLLEMMKAYERQSDREHGSAESR